MKRLLVILLCLVSVSGYGAGHHTLTVDSLTVIGTFTSSVVPVGSIQMYGGASAPSGWLICDGTVASQSRYPLLYAAIGTAYNRGGETADSFRIPDFRGIFPQGVGTSGVYGANYVGTRGGYSQDKLQGHYHGVLRFDGTQYNGYAQDLTMVGGGAYSGGVKNSVAGSDFRNGQAITDGTNGTPRATGPITQPACLGVHFLIKY